MAKNYAGENSISYLITLIKSALEKKINKSDIANDLKTDDANKVLSAAQGKVLDEKIRTGTGDMRKEVYDTDNDGKVDAAALADNASALEGHGASYFETAGAAESYVTGQRGQANGLAPLNAEKQIDAQYLPSYVDDVVEGYLHNGNFYTDAEHMDLLPGEKGKIYVNLGEEGGSYRYSGSVYVKITSDDMVEIENSTVQEIWDQTFGV